ncbi:MAG: ankyrin repeat domain-containing protein [bacterium]
MGKGKTQLIDQLTEGLSLSMSEMTSRGTQIYRGSTRKDIEVVGDFLLDFGFNECYEWACVYERGCWICEENNLLLTAIVQSPETKMKDIVLEVAHTGGQFQQAFEHFEDRFGNNQKIEGYKENKEPRVPSVEESKRAIVVNAVQVASKLLKLRGSIFYKPIDIEEVETLMNDHYNRFATENDVLGGAACLMQRRLFDLEWNSDLDWFGHNDEFTDEMSSTLCQIGEKIYRKKLHSKAINALECYQLSSGLKLSSEESINMVITVCWLGHSDIPYDDLTLWRTALPYAVFLTHLNPKKDYVPDLLYKICNPTTSSSLTKMCNLKEIDLIKKTKDLVTDLVTEAGNGHIERVKQFFAQGVDINVNTKNKDGFTALMMASRNGHQEVVKLLLARGADANVKHDEGDWTALMLAATKGNIEIIKSLLDQGAQINSESADDKSALSLAAEFGHLETAKLLLANDAEVNPKKHDKGTPLMFAAHKGHAEMVILLLEHGADVNAKTRDGWTALLDASDNGFYEVVKLLLEHGADVDYKYMGGGTALIYASESGHREVVQLLLENEADINMKNNDGVTPLMHAVNKNRIEVVRLLLEKGADLNVKNIGNETALMRALLRGFTEVADLLVAHSRET